MFGICKGNFYNNYGNENLNGKRFDGGFRSCQRIPRLLLSFFAKEIETLVTFCVFRVLVYKAFKKAKIFRFLLVGPISITARSTGFQIVRKALEWSHCSPVVPLLEDGAGIRKWIFIWILRIFRVIVKSIVERTLLKTIKCVPVWEILGHILPRSRG